MRALLLSALLVGCTPSSRPTPSRDATRALAWVPVDRTRFHRFPFAPRDPAIDGPAPLQPVEPPHHVVVELPPASIEPPSANEPQHAIPPALVDKLETRVKARWRAAIDAAGARLDMLSPSMLESVRAARKAWLASLDASSPVPVTETRFALVQSFSTVDAELRDSARRAAFGAFGDDETQRVISVVLEAISGDPKSDDYRPGKARGLVTDYFLARAGVAADVAYRARAPGYRQILVKPGK
jgi:hypothetical protein